MSLSSHDLLHVSLEGLIPMGKGYRIVNISHCMPSCINDLIPFTI